MSPGKPPEPSEGEENREGSSFLALEVPVGHSSLSSKKLSCLGCEKKPACGLSSAGVLLNHHSRERTRPNQFLEARKSLV